MGGAARAGRKAEGYFAGVKVLKAKNWSFPIDRETIDTTDMDSVSGWRRKIPNFASVNGSFNFNFDPEDATHNAIVQEAMNPSDDNGIEFEYYPTGKIAGELFYSCRIIVTGVDESAGLENVIEGQVSFMSTGDVTYGLVT